MYEKKIAFLQRILGRCKFSRTTKEALFYCPICKHHKPKLSINLETDLWQCFPCGSKGGRLVFLLSQASANREDLQEYAQKYSAKPVSLKLDDSSCESFSVKLPEDFKPIVNCLKSAPARRAINYLVNKRGLTFQDILQYKIGVSNAGEFKDTIVIPSFDDCGRVNFFTARSYSGRYTSPSVPKGYKNTIVINELNIDWTKPVIITEGFFDAFKSYRNTVPLLGSSLSKESKLFERLVVNKSEVYLALDSDAKLKSLDIARKLFSFDLVVKIITIPSPYNDLGEINKKSFINLYNNAKIWSPDEDFSERLKMVR